MQHNTEKGRSVYSVTRLTRELKTIIEDRFSFIWISGEISNLGMPSSGHCYFTLKDSNAQINAVIFRTQARGLKFKLENGLKITGLGRLSIYEPRGSYQFIFEYMEPSGLGSIQLAFEQLKRKLEEEGLFSPEYKKPIPFLPYKISVITSPTGAVIKDILNVVKRRFENIPIQIYPVKVQGEGADKEIVAGFEYLNSVSSSSVIILARGGGSLEDLAPFNSEIVARAIFKSHIPVISAVGHETDYTIADFVSDLRAPTPSAAAELAVPEKEVLEKKCRDLKYTLTVQMGNRLKNMEFQLNQLKKRLTDPRKKLQEMYLKVDDYTSRLIGAYQKFHLRKKEVLAWKSEKLFAKNPVYKITNYKEKIENYNYHLSNSMQTLLSKKKFNYNQLNSKLQTLNPKAILSRGYSITRNIETSKIVTDVKYVDPGQTVEVLFARGKITCLVEGKDNG